jgi:hypothetical protein
MWQGCVDIVPGRPRDWYPAGRGRERGALLSASGRRRAEPGVRLVFRSKSLQRRFKPGRAALGWRTSPGQGKGPASVGPRIVAGGSGLELLHYAPGPPFREGDANSTDRTARGRLEARAWVVPCGRCVARDTARQVAGYRPPPSSSTADQVGLARCSRVSTLFGALRGRCGRCIGRLPPRLDQRLVVPTTKVPGRRGWATTRPIPCHVAA